MSTQETLTPILALHGLTDFRWFDPHQVVVAQWVRMKCTFGCDSYGKSAACPPHTPTVAECRRLFDEYTLGAVLHFRSAMDKPEDRFDWMREVNKSLLPVERDVFLAGYPKAFLLFPHSCGLCKHCAGTPEECKHPGSARPAPEAMAVDVFSTVRALGLPIEVLTDYTQPMNRYGILLVE